MTIQAIEFTNFIIPGTVHFYEGKVRDVYFLEKKMVIVVTDRLSAFDHILPKGIPYKGQILNRIAAYMLEATNDIVPNWLDATPHANVSIGKKCEPIKLEMVVRKYLTGHAWRTYKSGLRELCGVALPEGMIENEAFETAIITPATKADEGHDEDISETEIVQQGIVSRKVYDQLKEYSLKLFARGTEIAAKRGLILVDTKYEFGIYNGEIMLIDEIHTPDSSRYFYIDSYEQNHLEGVPQKHLSKEFVREWLMSEGFQGLEGQVIPAMSDEVIGSISKRYAELYSILIGEEFIGDSTDNMEETILTYLEQEN